MIEALSLWGRLAAGLVMLELVGYALLALLTRPAYVWRPPERLSLAFGLGVLGLTWWMLALGFLQWPFSLPTILLPWLPVLLIGIYVAQRRGWWQTDIGFLRASAGLLFRDWRYPGRRWQSLLAWLLIGVFVLAGLRAVIYPMWEWDALSTWGLKAKAFYLARTLNLSRFEAHNYYPNLVPLLLAYLYFWLGAVMDNLVKLSCPLWGAAVCGLFYGLLRRGGLTRGWALAATVFLVTNGATFITHLFLAYADLPLAFYHLAMAGLLGQRLTLEERPPGLLLPMVLAGGLAWCKYEGWPLVLIIFIAAFLSLLWLRPSGWPGQLLVLVLILAGAYLLTWPWRLWLMRHDIVAGTDHLGSFNYQQLWLGLVAVVKALGWPPYFGIWWLALLLTYIGAGREVLTTPLIFIALLTLGNLAGVVLAYALVPASPAEFPLYIRATLDRLLLHFVPATGLALAWLAKFLPTGEAKVVN